MSWQTEGTKKIAVRTLMLSGVFLCFALILFARMFFLQVIEADRYQTLADKNRVGVRLLPPLRGKILDRNGKQIAYNRKTFRAVVVAEETQGKLKQTLENFGKLVPLEDEEYIRVLKEVRQKKSFVPVRVKDDLTFEEMAKLQLNIPDLPGISIEESVMRIYPFKNVGSHTTGYVSFIREEDLNENPDLSKMPDVRIGRTGIESFYEKDLYGQTGTKKVEINSIGREVQELELEKPVAGKDLKLSLDMRLQKVGYEALKNESGSAVLMDIHTGDVLMMISTPAYDSNIFNYPIRTAVWKGLNENERLPLLNKAIMGLYSPGSVFKIVVAIAGLEAGVIKENTKVKCEGKMMLGDHPFHCWNRYGHGEMNLHDALQHSCDIYFYEVAKETGVDKIIEVAERLGFGAKTGIDLYGERDGLVPTRTWKEGRFGEAWKTGDTLNLGIGQGFLLATPLQMVVMMARVANGERAVVPHLYNEEDREFEKLNISSSHLRQVKKGLVAVVNERGGTAYHTRFNVNGQKMGGKTASTQIRRISLEERESGVIPQHKLQWKDRDHAFFVAYAPSDKPKYALVVAVEHGGGGGTSAAPIAAQIMKRALELDILDKRRKK